MGSPAFNTALEAITNRFAGPNASPARPNASAINQVRSNGSSSDTEAVFERRSCTLE